MANRTRGRGRNLAKGRGRGRSVRRGRGRGARRTRSVRRSRRGGWESCAGEMCVYSENTP